MAMKHVSAVVASSASTHNIWLYTATVLAVGSTAILPFTALPAAAYVALMAGQRARPLNGQFNRVPVLHSNQPEEVEGPGILINTAPGYAYSSEINRNLRNAEYTFNGDFGVHLHHKYFPPYRRQIAPGQRRSELAIGLILINPGSRPVHLRFSAGAVRNSFEAPYLSNSMVGVRPLGPRPWNTGPGDATAVQLLRRRLDSRLSDEITIPPRSRIVLFETDLPALGIANALLRGKSDGPFQMAVVAAREPQGDHDLIRVLDEGRLAPGRVYLNRISEINQRAIFSRVGGVAIGDEYNAKINHNLNVKGPLHVPLTSTFRHHFGTKDVQVNPLATRMIDSSVDNVGTYGVRFNINLKLQGQGPHDLVLSHPAPIGGKPFIAFRGSIQVETPEGPRDVHVVLRSGQSLALSSLNLTPGVEQPVRLSLVYPADATPGHLLSVVPSTQLARVQDNERRLELARAEAERQAKAQAKGKGGKGKAAPKQPATAAPPPLPDVPVETLAELKVQPSPMAAPPPPPDGLILPPASFPRNLGPAVQPPPAFNQSLVDRYQQALEAQQQIMRGLMGQ